MYTYKEIIKMKCTEINALPEEEINEIIEIIINHYYEYGFPYYPLDIKKIEKEFEYLFKFNIKDLELPDNNLQQNMIGLNTVNSFHPEMWNVQCNKAKTPMEVFLDRKLFHTALRKRIKYSVTRLADYNIRKSLKAFGAQSVSNFRPTIAKWVYSKYCPYKGDVLDPCMGYGGRLLGAFSSDIRSYTGIDPNLVTCIGNEKLAYYLDMFSENYYLKTHFKCLPFEDYSEDKKFNLIFTSPPYFNIEKYSSDNTQSYIRYPKYEDWKEKFLRVLIQKSYNFLTYYGYLVLNVGKPIDKDTLEIGNEIFKQKPEIYYMRLSKILGQGDKNEQSHKTEPIFIWRKFDYKNCNSRTY